VSAVRAAPAPEPTLPTLTKTCPSAPAELGSVVLGVVVGPGQVAYLAPSVPVTPELLDGLKESGVPIENRMRFACACREHQCKQWSGGAGEGGHCGLVDRAIEALGITEELGDLPNCGIRSTCRWFAQHRRKACAACPEVIRRPAV
jgi:hypothetical protein